MKGINKMISAKEARKQTRLSRVSEDEVEQGTPRYLPRGTCAV